MFATLTLIGPLRLTDAAGRDLTPRGLKARAALALLATAPGMCLSRAALQDRLWSDRDQRQGSDSLRQMLRELRATAGALFAPAPEGFLALNPDLVQLNLDPVWDVTGQPVPFAADLDPIRDPEFEDWLRDMRLQLDAEPAPQGLGDRVVQMDPVIAAQPEEALPAEILLAEGAAHACDWLPARLVAGPDSARRHGLRLRAMVRRGAEGALVLSVIVSDLTSDIALETRRMMIEGPTAPPPAVVVSDIAAMLIAAGQRAATQAPQFPLADAFSFSAARLTRADRCLIAQQDGPSGQVALALRAWLRHTRMIERLDHDADSLLDEASVQIGRAVALGPQNATVLSVASLQAAMRFQTGAALELAQQALRLNRDNDLAHYAMSFALTEAGRDADALAWAYRSPGGILASLAPASLHLRRAVTHLRMHQFPQAETAAMIALAYAPDCRPALRFLLALRAQRRDEEGAAQTLAALVKVEPDFTPAAFLDPDYPAHTLRHAGLSRFALSL